MNATACPRPLPDDTLVEYWLGDLGDARTQEVDLHLLGCDACGARLDALVALADGVRGAFGAGLFGTVVGAGFAQRLAERGLRLREYRVPRNGSVECSVAPDDEVVIARLAAPLAGIARLDLLHGAMPGEPEARAADIPFDAASGEVILASPVARLRELPDCTERMRLVAVDEAGERVVGDYTFNHRAAR